MTPFGDGKCVRNLYTIDPDLDEFLDAFSKKVHLPRSRIINLLLRRLMEKERLKKPEDYEGIGIDL